MNFVNSVLFTVEKNTISDVKSRIPSLQAELNENKIVIDKYFQDIHTKHLLEPKSNVQLEKLQLLLNEINNMHHEVKEISTRNFPLIDNELNELRDNVTAADFTTQQLNAVIKIHESFKKIEEAMVRESFTEAVQELHSLMEYVKSVANTSELICVQRLLNKAYNVNDEVSYTLADLVSKAILFNSCKQDNNVTNTITIKERVDILDDVFKACYIQSLQTDANVDYMSSLIPFLWTEIITPVVCNQSKLELSCTYLKINYNSNDTEQPFYKDVFDKLLQVFEYLHEMLNYPLDDNCNVMQLIGADIRDNLSELLINKCLVYTIPTTSEGLAQYSQVITDTEVFQKRLVELNVFSAETRSIIDHVNKIDVHFINNKCNIYITDALYIMKEDLHDTIEVGGIEDGEFPKCCVSKSVVKIIELGEKILDWATKSPDDCEEKLFSTMQKIFDMYPSEVKLNHSALLDTIPQQVAIFFNNCMYMAHMTSELKGKYGNKLRNLIKSMDLGQFSSIIKNLRDSGSGLFEICIQEQIHAVTETLASAELDTLKTNDNLNFENTERAIRQCLRQQELLKTVWQKVLPGGRYNSGMGVILDRSCNIILIAILSAEDINSTNAEYLVDILKLVLTRGPKLFQPNTDLSEFVPNWNKISGLVFILHASMIDICEKWTNRMKSDLFRDFKAEEMRQLIKAIFQNSDRRANILTKIQD